jgi:hypothetical protein
LLDSPGPTIPCVDHFELLHPCPACCLNVLKIINICFMAVMTICFLSKFSNFGSKINVDWSCFSRYRQFSGSVRFLRIRRLPFSCNYYKDVHIFNTS